MIPGTLRPSPRGHRWTPWRIRARWPRPLAGLALAAMVCLPAVPALGVDGHVEVRLTHQESRSGDQAVRSDDRWELLSLGERIKLTRRLLFELQYNARREVLRGSAAGTSVDNSVFAQNPAVSLTWQADALRAHLFARGRRLDQEFSGSPLIRDESLEAGMWSAFRRGPLNLNLSLRDGTSWRFDADETRKNRERLAEGDLRWEIGRHETLHLRATRTDLNAMSTGNRTRFATEQAQYDGERAFAGSRGRVDWSAMFARFTQRQTTVAEVGRRYVRPVAAGWWIDDTPEVLDPLESQPEVLPALNDNDRTTPTAVNLGDNAPTGRDFGGDYRNLYVDFGEALAMDAVFLYVDRRLTFIPDILQWDLYFCDESEGRDWGAPVSPATWTARFVELETGQQGWEFVFAQTETHRRLKLVDRKLGTTMGELFVTELEVLVNGADELTLSRMRQDRLLLQGSVEYRFHPRLQARYDTHFDRSTLRGTDGDQRRLDQTWYLGWRRGGWLLAGQAQLADERSPTGLGTSANTQTVSLGRQAPGRLSARASWTRTADDNYDVQHTTQSVGADATWRAAPLLTLSQKLSRGWRWSDGDAADSDSWVATTEIRSTPRPGLRLDLRRANRWVSRETGPGFTTYNTTQIDASWEIAPLLYWWGQYTSQARDRRDWILRNSLSWTPLQSGSLKFGFQATDTQDSRLDQLRRGGGATLEWRARPRLFLSGNVDKSYERLAQVRSWPLSAQVRGYWTF